MSDSGATPRDNPPKSWLIWGALVGVVGLLALLRRSRYEPGASSTKWLFRLAASKAGVPGTWASSDALHKILQNESGGWVGQPNYTYGDRARDHSRWPEIWAELKQGIRSTSSSATGLGQLLVGNVEKYYPSGLRGIGNPLDEAVCSCQSP